MDDKSKNILEILRATLEKLGIAYEDIRIDQDEKTHSTRFMIHTPDSALLIGERGARLQALNHIVKKMIEKKGGNPGGDEGNEGNFFIDVNDYQKKRIDDLRSKAHVLAERARYFKSSVDMEPMSSYERMIIHSEFAEIPDILTESSGRGKDRHVTLKYTESKTAP